MPMISSSAVESERSKPSPRCGDDVEAETDGDENKTRVCYLPEEKFDFLGYTFGRCYSMRRGRVYLGTVPSKKRVQRICRAISDETGRDKVRQDSKTIVARLNRMMIGWANYFCLGPVSKAYNAVDLQRLCTLCMAWSSYHTGPRTFRGRKRESFPRAGCGKSASPVR